MGYYDDSVVADLECRFSGGETPTWEEFYKWIEDIQKGIEQHAHTGGGGGDAPRVAYGDLTGTGAIDDALNNTGASALVAAIAANTAAITALQSDLATHIALTLSVHGIADTGALATQSYVDTKISTDIGTHAAVTLSVHGIASTANLATHSYVDAAEADAKAYADTQIGTHAAASTAVHGVGGSYVCTTLALAQHETASSGVHAVGASSVASESYADQAEADAKSYADTQIGTHAGLDTGVHGVGGSYVCTTLALASHESASTWVHAVGGSSVASESYVDTAEADAKSYADSEISTHNLAAAAHSTRSWATEGFVDNEVTDAVAAHDGDSGAHYSQYWATESWVEGQGYCSESYAEDVADDAEAAAKSAAYWADNTVLDSAFGYTDDEVAAHEGRCANYD